MSSIQCIIFIIFVTTALSNYCQAPLPKVVSVPKGYNLIFVQTLTRHGDRSPMNSFDQDDAFYNCSGITLSSVRESDSIGKAGDTIRINVIDKNTNPYAKNFMWKGNCETSQLTVKGIRQHHNLGIYQRKKYLDMGFLPVEYDPRKIYIRSTERSRTIQSSQAFSQTFYPPETRLQEKIIPIYVVPKDIEIMFPNRDLCSEISKREKDTYKIALVNQTRLSVQRFEEKAIKILGFKSKYDWLEDYVDIMNCRICHNISLPCRNGECLTIEDYNQLWYQTQLENRYLFRTDGLAQLQIGLFLKELIDRAEMALNGTSSYVYEHYTGHDSTLLPYLALIGQDVFTWPPYASHIDIEIYSFEGERYVRVVYNNEVISLPICHQVDGFCKWEEYKDYLLKKGVVSMSECKPK
ncbi:hypothetical protein ENUP19_0078G0010 [Entamoeba nuttalli]|uniref:Histidine acid phosphatase family protein n=2 Tax=Entamoeba nuttalli TaxID=412467 RepID=K2HQS8_ENTNP|nr:histidine acid phosphatase family protein [Entamoeba nuttalli P19]EKE38315.1 histidine acid phosphatase family protein [Entamoeba nuttalli P19]|eukprot:XP_008859353.1 histidine acid phosphatase family protein [Entamoeba nuttalli P19]